MIIPEEKFSVSIEGKETKERYIGDFTVRVKLSQAQKMLRSRLIRQYLGDLMQYATEDDRLRAAAMADCDVSIVKAPDWWRQSNNGLDLVDDNVVGEVWSAVAKAQDRLKKEVDQKTEEDRQAIKEALEESESKKE